MKSFAIIATIILTVLAMGCVQGPQNNQDNQDTFEPINDYNYSIPNGTSSIKILTPKTGDVINLSIVGIYVNVTNFRLAHISSDRENKPNEGHIHYFLNDVERMSSLASESFGNVEPGEYTLRAELRNNDHSALMPPVYDIIRIRVQGK